MLHSEVSLGHIRRETHEDFSYGSQHWYLPTRRKTREEKNHRGVLDDAH